MTYDELFEWNEQDHDWIVRHCQFTIYIWEDEDGGRQTFEWMLILAGDRHEKAGGSAATLAEAMESALVSASRMFNLPRPQLEQDILHDRAMKVLSSI